MKEDTIDDLKKRVRQLEEHNSGLIRDYARVAMAIEIMVAAGLISKAKVDKAYEIVDDLKS